MEPMDFDEDNPEVARMGQSRTYRLTPAKFVPYSSSSLSGSQTQSLDATLLSGSPCRRTVSATNTWPRWNTFSVHNPAVESDYDSAGSLSFNPAMESTQRRATPVESWTSQRQSGYQEEGNTSMNSSDRSDVSEIEASQCSPSPSWDRVISAFKSITMFKSMSDVDQTSHLDAQQYADKRKDQGDVNTWSTRPSSPEMVRNRSWEPALSVTRSVTTLKRKRSSAKSPEMQRSKTCVSQVQATPIKKLSWEGDGYNATESAKHASRMANQPGESSSFSSSHSTCNQGESGCKKCYKLFFALIIGTSVLMGVLFQIQVAHHRKHFAEFDAELLRNEMASKVFGQHVAINVVPQYIQKYLQLLNEKREKCSVEDCQQTPLVLSFHGWTGVGKNFVSDIIAKLFPSKTVTKLLVPYHFPHETLDHLYEMQVENWILSNTTKYHINIFIFDEMDKSTSGVVKGLQKAIRKLAISNSVYSPSIFLLLSNTLGSDINRQTFQAMLTGKERESVSADEFSPLFSSCSDPWYKSFLSENLISASVPFLPLEKQHVVQCIRRDLVSKKMSTQPDMVARVLNELTFVTLESGHQFSQTGCKRVFDKVNLVMFTT